MDVKRLQERLERTFTQQGLVGGKLRPVLDAEHACGEFVMTNFHGQLALGDSFQAFVIETLQLAETQYRASPQFRTLQWYSYMLLLQLANFRTVRAAEILYTNGRPGPGYGILRDLKDRVILLGAVGNGFTSLNKISGVDSKTATLSDFLSRTLRLKNRRTKVERAARAKMIGTQSGLSEATQKELRKWEEFFHLEVHGSRLTSIFEDEAWMKGRELLPIRPSPNIDTLTTYMNRFCEVCWMILRTLCLLQLDPQGFGQEWTEKWQVLEESFEAVVKDLEKQGKQISSAVIELLGSKFQFLPNTASYPPE